MDYEEFHALKTAKKQSQFKANPPGRNCRTGFMEGFGWIPDNSGCLAGRLLPLVGREISGWGKTPQFVVH